MMSETKPTTACHGTFSLFFLFLPMLQQPEHDKIFLMMLPLSLSLPLPLPLLLQARLNPITLESHLAIWLLKRAKFR